MKPLCPMRLLKPTRIADVLCVAVRPRSVIWRRIDAAVPVFDSQRFFQCFGVNVANITKFSTGRGGLPSPRETREKILDRVSRELPPTTYSGTRCVFRPLCPRLFGRCGHRPIRGYRCPRMPPENLWPSAPLRVQNFHLAASKSFCIHEENRTRSSTG